MRYFPERKEAVLIKARVIISQKGDMLCSRRERCYRPSRKSVIQTHEGNQARIFLYHKENPHTPEIRRDHLIIVSRNMSYTLPGFFMEPE